MYIVIIDNMLIRVYFKIQLKKLEKKIYHLIDVNLIFN